MQLGELVVPLKLDGSNFKSGIGDAGSQLADFAKKALSVAAVTAAVVGVAKAMKGAFEATQKWADELDSIQDVTGVTDKAAAALAATLRKSGVSTESFTGAMTILNKGLVDAKGKLDVTGKALKAWGINVLDANGKLKDQESILEDVAKRYSEFGTQQERVNFLTEVFGRSGASLVDFFETLAQDGGIDTVASKMERLGLAISPERYVQFNKNLEEMKLIGLSLAVGFTEKIMPSLEKFTEWVMEEGIPAAVDFKENLEKAFDEGGLSGAFEFLGEELSKAVKDIDWNQAVSDIVTGFVDITDAIDSGLANAIKSKDWTSSGDAFGNALAAALTGGTNAGIETSKSQAIPALAKAINDWLLGAMNMTNWSDFGKRLGVAVGGSINYAQPAINATSLTTGQKIALSLTTGFVQQQPLFTAALSTFNQLLDSKLRDIAKTFFTRALAWTAQAKAGFNNGLPALLASISDLVGEINKILKKIITSFKVNVSIGTVGGDIKPPKDRPDNNFGDPDDDVGGGRATGGAVIAGQSYNVAEFYKPEVFTPSTNGRVDNMGANQTKDVSINNWDSFPFDRLATEMVKAWNNA